MDKLIHTPFYDVHVSLGAKLVPFAAHSLPIHYGSQVKEHEAVRTDAGMFDVSHMVIVDITGADARNWLRYLVTHDVDKLDVVGKVLYTGMLNENGGVIDDMLVYRTGSGYRIVSNAGTREKDIAWFTKTAEPFAVTLNYRDDLAILAVQGPKAVEKLLSVKPNWAEKVNRLTSFTCTNVGTGDGVFVSRTGYTGEDGVEILIPAAQAIALFNALKDTGVTPCGLGARDTLRLEAGMNLNGHDMDETITPLMAGMAWTVTFTDDRDFIGKDALLKQKADGLKLKQVGLVFEGKGILREGMKVLIEGVGEGITTSGTFSPTLGYSIAIARVPVATTVTSTVAVEMRGKAVPVRVVKLPFVYLGKKVFD